MSYTVCTKICTKVCTKVCNKVCTCYLYTRYALMCATRHVIYSLKCALTFAITYGLLLSYRSINSTSVLSNPSSHSKLNSSSSSKDCLSLPKETTMLLHDLMSLGAFSVWLCHPLAFSNNINGLFEAIFHFLEVHCELEGLKRADLCNVYHHYCHGREPTTYHRYK